MPGFRTYNRTDQPVWVTIYTLGGVFQEDWGDVEPGQTRDWYSGNYAWGSYYQVRGQWPTQGSVFDTNTTVPVADPKQLVLMGGASGVWWSNPIVRTVNTLAVPVWVTVYTGAQEGTKQDWGNVEAGATRDWATGDYGPGSIVTLLAEWDDGSPVQVRGVQAAPPPPDQARSVRTGFIQSQAANGIGVFQLSPSGADAVWQQIV
jgi:hypothetical protein